MNQPYARVNQPYATLTLASALREMFGVQLYRNNARALLLRTLSVLNLDWLQHARSVRGVYELTNNCLSLMQIIFVFILHPQIIIVLELLELFTTFAQYSVSNPYEAVL